MNNLEQYNSYFEQAYPDYADGKHSEICSLVKALPESKEAISVFSSPDAKTAFGIVLPLIKIKNYKSQIPFPEDFFEAAEIIVEIKNNAANGDLLGDISMLFDRLLDVRGFQLPTVSAVFHFCHPTLYPIIDRNIEAACGLLSKGFPDEFDEGDIPTLPASTTSSKNKRSKYQCFIRFLSKLKEKHNAEHCTVYDYRDLDMALMVYGVSKYRLAAENANKAFQRTSR